MNLGQWPAVQDCRQQKTQWKEGSHAPEEGARTWPITCSVGKSCPFFPPLLLTHKVGRIFPALMIVTIFMPAAIY